MYHEGTGIIKYDPPRPGMKKRTKWWAIVEVDSEITRYFRWMVKKNLWIDLCQPSWDAHISIIRGEKPPKDKMHLWKKYHKQKVTFKYFLDVKQNNASSRTEGTYWFVEVECPLLKQIRDEFGFRSNWRQHLTIGRTWY